jgi:hypothetical protein
MLPSFCHLATFGDHEVYVGAGDNWAVKNGSRWCDALALKAKASLLWLPLLEYEYLAVRAALLAGLRYTSPEPVAERLTTFPVQHLLRLALTGGNSWYWVDLALGWASHLTLESYVRQMVQALALDHSVPQPTRHRAKRLYYTGKAKA